MKPTDEVYSIGISAGDDIFKTTASAKELSNLKVELNTSVNNSTKISCVIVKLNEKSYSTLLCGSTETTKAMEKSVFVQNLLYKTQIIESQQYDKTRQNNHQQNSAGFAYQNADNFAKQSLNERQEEIFEDEMLENYIDKVMAQTEDENRTNKNQDEKKEEFFNNQNEKNFSNAFYDKVSNQVEKMFEQNEPEKTLEKLLPNSKFCKVNSDSGFYVFGVITENGFPKCLCYGVPAEYYDVPPKEIEGYCQWLPVDAENYKGSGYWMTYQDAITGENVEVEVIN